eukprot:14757102-Heterocapsa_arctica.AAC.1
MDKTVKTKKEKTKNKNTMTKCKKMVVSKKIKEQSTIQETEVIVVEEESKTLEEWWARTTA